MMKKIKMKKFEKILEIHSYLFSNKSNNMENRFQLVCEALYISAKGTNHFHEVLDFLINVNPKYQNILKPKKIEE